MIWQALRSLFTAAEPELAALEHAADRVPLLRPLWLVVDLLLSPPEKP